MDEVEKAKLSSALAECRVHASRIGTALEAVGGLFPLSVESTAVLSDDAVAHLDQLIYRFTKLQDTMGTRLLPTLYSVLQADALPRPFIDILNHLEKLGVLLSVADWQFFRDLRNSFAHEYPDRPEQTVASLNERYASWPRFRALYERSIEKTENLL